MKTTAHPSGYMVYVYENNTPHDVAFFPDARPYADAIQNAYDFAHNNPPCEVVYWYKSATQRNKTSNT